MISSTLNRLFQVIFFLLLTCGVYKAQATHIKAGDIKAVRTSTASLTYTFTLTLYTNIAAMIPQDKATLSFGDGTSQEVNRLILDTGIGNGTAKNVYVFTHTYKAAGFYKAGFREENRNAGILNMAGSVSTAFYVELALSIDPFLGLNNSPVLSVPPIDEGVVGQIYTHNPGAYDPDGDSISYKFVTPQSSAGVNVLDYRLPGNPYFGGTATTGGPAFMTINALTGDIVWNAPSSFGLTPRYYNIAIMIEEWRSGVRIGYVIRDMQIEIKVSPNKPPVLKVPKDTCIVAGTLLNNSITATHPTSNNIFVESYSGIYSLPSSPATYSVSANNSAFPVLTYHWQTDCSHIREQPYEIVFRAIDKSTVAPQLTDVRSMLVYVKAPKPQNLVTTPLATGIKLDWQPYTTCGKVVKMKIYRKECGEAHLNPEPCDDGIPGTSGYVFIKEVDGTLTTYTDNNNGAGLVPGVVYCYALVAAFPAPGYGISYPSNESCGQIDVDVAMAASASVTNTDAVNGTIVFKWFEPLDYPTPPPYIYNIFRASSDAPTVFTQIATSVSGTSFNDTGLNTRDKQYFYKTQVVGSAEFAPVQSSVIFTAAPRNSAAFLSWNITTVCNLDTIEIYRSINGALPYDKIATLLTKQKVGTYTDGPNALVHNCDTINYYILVKGRYCDPRLVGELYSLSPIREVIPLDDTPPRAPDLTLRSCAAPHNLTVNDLRWTSVTDPVCPSTIKGYNVYYAPHNNQGLSVLTFTDTTFYIHPPVDNSYAGCYEIKAVNYANVEGAASNRICIDNCVYYRLPNLVTRNNDGHNDLFQAYPVPLGVKVVRFNVYNRWGTRVYGFEGDPNINWTTVDASNNLLSEGVYYYEAEVHYSRRLNPDDEVETLKGWINILGDKETPKK